MDRAHAAVLVAPCRFEFRDFAIPQPDENGGVLRVEAAGLCGTDYEIMDGNEAIHVHLDCTGGTSP